jgi:bacterioferritin-associated ferredoxin
MTTGKEDWPEGFIPAKRATAMYVLGVALGVFAGYFIASRLAATSEVKERIVPYGVPCAECAKHAADKIAAASVEMHHPAHLAAEDDDD